MTFPGVRMIVLLGIDMYQSTRSYKLPQDKNASS